MIIFVLIMIFVYIFVPLITLLILIILISYFSYREVFINKSKRVDPLYYSKKLVPSSLEEYTKKLLFQLNENRNE